MVLLILYVVLALSVSFACSIMEAVVLSVTPAHVAVLERQGKAAGPRLRQLKESIDRPLSAILSLNTIAHTVGAAGAGAQAAKVFGSAAVGIFSAILTLLILVLSEIIPKTLGAVHWKRLAPLVERALRFLVLALYPLVLLSDALTRLLTPADRDPAVSRDEIEAMAEEGRREGVVQEEESRILKSLFRFRGRAVRDIMTPADSAFMLPEDAAVADVVAAHPEMRFSRIPLQDGDGTVRAFVLKDDILAAAAAEEARTPLAALRREVLGVREDLPLPDLFDHLVERAEHMAVVTDEEGRLRGVVTMEDLIETLLDREIEDEADAETQEVG